MTLVLNSAEGGVSGTNITTSNTGGTSGTAFSNIGPGTGSITFSNAQAAHGSLSYAVTGAASSGEFFGWNTYNDTSVAVRFYFNTGPSLPNSQLRILDVRNSSASALRVFIDTTNKLFIQNSTGTTIKTFANALSANTWYRIEVALSVSATAAVINTDYYAGDSTTPAETGYSTTTGNTGSTNITDIRFGSVATASWTGTMYFDDLATNNGTTSYIGPYSSGTVAAPTANAGTNQTVFPYATITLNGSATTASGHTATFVWSALSGAPAITSGSTTLSPAIANIGGPVVASAGSPIDTIYTYQLTVTQDDGQTASSTVTVTVLYANRYRAHTGSWKPQLPTKRAHNSSWI